MIRDCTPADLPGVLDIYNEAVRSSTAIWNETIVDLENRAAWLADRGAKGFPVLIAVEDAKVLGYASFGDWRAWDGYRHTVEHSIYVHANARRGGIGRTLLGALIERARRQGKHVMVGGIEASNAASVGLHQRLGFKQVAYMPEVGMKFGRWLDLVFMQLILNHESRAS